MFVLYSNNFGVGDGPLSLHRLHVERAYPVTQASGN